MKWTTDPVTQVLAKLRDSAALQGVDFCRAYPNQMKPSRLLRPVVAVCLAEMDGTSDAVGEESRAGQIALRFDLYAPPAAGTGALQQVLSGICRTLLDRRVCCLLYPFDAVDGLLSVSLGGRRSNKKKMSVQNCWRTTL